MITVQAGRRQLCTAWPYTTFCSDFSLFFNRNTCVLVVILEGNILPGRFVDIPDWCDGKMPEYTAIFGTPCSDPLACDWAAFRLYPPAWVQQQPLSPACMGWQAVRGYPLACEKELIKFNVIVFNSYFIPNLQCYRQGIGDVSVTMACNCLCHKSPVPPDSGMIGPCYNCGLVNCEL